MAVKKSCLICEKEFSVIDRRKDTAKYCGTSCRDIGLQGVKDTPCKQCGTMFHRKPYRKKTNKLGFFCSIACLASYKSIAYLGENNPNNRYRETDYDGYPIYSPQCPEGFVNGKKVKIHIAVAMETLGLDKIPKGFHVHHRDCNVMNNVPTNLVVLSTSDHVWLHKQFGRATLWAYMQGKIKAEDLVSWSDDPERANYILMLDVTQQTTDLITYNERNKREF